MKEQRHQEETLKKKRPWPMDEAAAKNQRPAKLVGLVSLSSLFLLLVLGVPDARPVLSPFESEIFAQGTPLPTVDWKKLRELNIKTGKASASLKGFAGKRVRIPGFMVPLEDSQTSVSEFLLVPYPQACIHVPAPPANQIVHVTMKKGKKAPIAWYEPIWANGVLHIQKSKSIYAEASFTMTGDSTEVYEEY